jgi:hypothetical protein
MSKLKFFSLYINDEAEPSIMSSARDLDDAKELVEAMAKQDRVLGKRIDAAHLVELSIDGTSHTIKRGKGRIAELASTRPMHPSAAAGHLILDKWNACAVRRWHTNPHLCDTADRIDGHSTRVALIALALRPSLTREALIYAITHDLGEHAVGDLASPAKRANPEFAKAAAELESVARYGFGFDHSVHLDPYDLAAIELADRLDAWLWMCRHNPGLRLRADWVEAIEGALDAAEDLGVRLHVSALVARVGNELSLGIPA